jgi:2'-5' RNA ligase
MPRLFVAIELPELVKDHLTALQTSISGARWVGREQMHLTLRFIGADVPEAQVVPIKAALDQVRSESFMMTVRDVGRFPPGKRAARVLWAGVAADKTLQRLHQSIETALAGVGFAPETRDFHPHITLARLKNRRPEPDVNRFLEEHASFTTGSFLVNTFFLIRSNLAPQGPQYRHDASYELGQGEHQ